MMQSFNVKKQKRESLELTPRSQHKKPSPFIDPKLVVGKQKSSKPFTPPSKYTKQILYLDSKHILGKQKGSKSSELVENQKILKIMPLLPSPTNIKQAINICSETLKDTKQASRLASLPREIQLKIIKLLDAPFSICLGLTSKRFHQLHRAAQLRIPTLGEMVKVPHGESFTAIEFGFLLQRGWLPTHLAFEYRTQKLMTKEELASVVMEKRMEREEVERNIRCKKWKYSSIYDESYHGVENA